MKANEAPERIWIDNLDEGFWFDNPSGNKSIEYTRTDAFIEKALKWYCLDCECNDNCKDTKCFFYREYERYLNGESNALPPKFSGRILDEDGSLSDNWRYRHIITKILDSFIEKACKWLKDNITYIHPRKGTKECIVNLAKFKNYMKGE